MAEGAQTLAAANGGKPAFDGDAWNGCLMDMVRLAKAHAYLVLQHTFVTHVRDLRVSVNPEPSPLPPAPPHSPPLPTHTACAPEPSCLLLLKRCTRTSLMAYVLSASVSPPVLQSIQRSLHGVVPIL